MTRRGHGEGSIYLRRDGRWAAAITLEQRRRKVFYGQTRREVQEKLTAALRERDLGLSVNPERQTLGQFLAHWLESIAKPSLRPRTFQRYAELVNLHIIPTLGKRRLQKLAPQDLQSLYAQKLAGGLSARTVGHVHRVMHNALGHAVRWNLVARNVADLVDPPRVDKREMQALTGEQAKALLIAAQGDPLEALFVLALTTGMRKGELIGLKWEDIDFVGGTLQVRRSLGRVVGQGFLESEPKSATGRRLITLTPLAISALKNHRQRQLENRLRAEPEWENRDLVFSNAFGRPLEGTNLSRRSFFPLLERAGLPRIRFHDLRHSAASLLLSLGTHPKVVQEILGHAQIGITMDIYSHLFPGLQGGATARLNAFLEGN